MFPTSTTWVKKLFELIGRGGKLTREATLKITALGS